MYTKDTPCRTHPPAEADSSNQLVWGFYGFLANGKEHWFQPYWFTVAKSFERGRGIPWAHHGDWEKQNGQPV